VEVLSDTEEEPNDSLVRSIGGACRAAVARAGIEHDVKFACLLTDGPRIRRLNRQFRSIDRETDVLAFPRGDGNPGGDIAIALDLARTTAAGNCATTEAEVAYLAAHAALHLLGHDHHTDDDYRKMRDEEDGILAMMGLANPRRSTEII
jgi:probable rRNA maturation factor